MLLLKIKKKEKEEESLKILSHPGPFSRTTGLRDVSPLIKPLIGSLTPGGGQSQSISWVVTPPGVQVTIVVGTKPGLDVFTTCTKTSTQLLPPVWKQTKQPG